MLIFHIHLGLLLCIYLSLIYISNGRVTLMSESELFSSRSLVSMVHTLQSLRDEKLLQAMSDLAPGSLPAQQEVLRTLALLLTGDDSEVREAVTLYLTAASRNEHFREKVGHKITGIEPEACLIFYHLLLIFCHLFFSKNNFLPLIDNIYPVKQFKLQKCSIST